MEELSFRLEKFEGPLDLMLTLIQRHKLNIRDIEISVLLTQYLDYLDKAQEADLDLAGEFIEMAAHLIYIKTAELLPKHEVEELKKELTGRLIDYALCKAAAERLKRHYRGDLVFVRDPMEIPVDNTYHGEHNPEELLLSYLAVSTKSEKLRKDAQTALRPIVVQSYVSMFTKLIYILRKLKNNTAVSVKALYDGQSRSAQVAIFLALLELSKNGRIDFSEDGEFITKKKVKAGEGDEADTGYSDDRSGDVRARGSDIDG